MKSKRIARMVALLLLFALLISVIPFTGLIGSAAAETPEAVETESQIHVDTQEPEPTEQETTAEDSVQETEASETSEAIEEAEETEATEPVSSEEEPDDPAWMDAGLLLLVDGTLVPYNPITGECDMSQLPGGTRAIPSSIYYSDVLGAHGSDLNGSYIKSGGLYDSWVYGNNQWWPYSTGVLSPYTNKRVRTDMLYCNDGPSHYKTESGVLAIPIRPSQESGWSMDVSGYGSYTTRSTGVPTYKSESLYTKMVPNYSAATWTQINLIYGVARGMGGMVESGNTNITAAASTLISNVVFGNIGLGSDKLFHGKPILTNSSYVNTQMLEILVRCEVYSKEKGLTGSFTGDNTVAALKAKGYTATDTTGWYVLSGTAASTAMGYFQINKSQSNGNQIYIYATNEITFDSGSTISLKKTTQNSSSVAACIQDNPLYTLQGAVYEIHQGSATGTVVETLTTNANGEAVGTRKYTLGTKLYAVEKTAPSGYLLNTTPVELTVSSGSNVFNVADTPTFDPNNLVITKTGKEGTRIEGAVFKVEFFASNWADSSKLLRTWYFQSNASGVVRFTENFLASGYASDPLFTLNGTIVVPLGCVLVTEVETASGYLLPTGNAAKVFMFIRQGGTKTAQMGKPAGAYWGNGSADPLSSDNPKDIYLIQNDADKTKLTAENTEVYGKPFTLQKTDPSNVPLSGAIFKVEYFSAGWFDSTKLERTWYFQTNANGFFTLSQQYLASGYTSDELFPTNQIPVGIMRVREVKAPDGFQLVSFTGIWRMKQHESGSSVVDSYWAAGDGNTPTTSYGDVAYVLDADPAKLYVRNEPIDTPVEIIKTSPDGEVAGISFKVECYESEGGVGWWEMGTFQTDASGKIQIDPMPIGTKLRITEIVPENYICLSQNPQTITIAADSNQVSFENKPVSKLELIKQSDDGNVKDISFLIEEYEPEDGVGWWSRGTYKTDANGKISLELKYGYRYRITETVPDDYVCDNRVQKFTAQTGTNTVTFVNHPIVKLELIKSADNGHVADIGFKFEKYDTGSSKWVLMDTYQTDADGKIHLEDLSVGLRLRITELVPAGYQTETVTKEITLVRGTNTVSFENYRIYGDLELIKVDESYPDTTLSGAEFTVTITYPGREPVEVPMPEVLDDQGNGTGVYRLEHIEYGSVCVVRETKAPEGFELSDKSFTVTIEEAKTYSIGDPGFDCVTNREKSGKIQIKKVDTQGRAMPGVSFLLEFSLDGTNWAPVTFRETDSAVTAGGCTNQNLDHGILVTDRNGLAVYPGLALSLGDRVLHYRLTEVSTQNGMQLLSEPAFEGTLPYNGAEEITVTAVNTEGFTIPATGGAGFVSTAIGVSLAGTAALALLLLPRKKKGAAA